jgi:hypothetical protein
VQTEMSGIDFLTQTRYSHVKVPTLPAITRA